MKRLLCVLLVALICSACTLHKNAAPANPDAAPPAPRKRWFSLPRPPQDGEDHFWEQNWRNNG